MKARHLLTVVLFAAVTLVAERAAAQTNLEYFPLTPCRVVDTRRANAVNGGPILAQDATRDFKVQGTCGVPVGAKAVSLNVTVTQANQSSFLTIWPSGLTRPVVSTINFESSDPALANGAIVGLSVNTNDLSVYNNFGQVHFILDVTGYFQ